MSYHQYPGCQTCKNARKGMIREHNFFSSKGPVIHKKHRRSACVPWNIKIRGPATRDKFNHKERFSVSEK